MKADNKIKYHCVLCGRETSNLHEVIFGRGFRKKSIEYNIQVPLCTEPPLEGKYPCDKRPHSEKGKQMYYKLLFSRIHMINFYEMARSMRGEYNGKYLEDIKQQCYQNLIDMRCDI